jgi:EAL domain-containing protein (putative c-di-GMP-specific phosphodiesterase class I)
MTLRNDGPAAAAAPAKLNDIRTALVSAGIHAVYQPFVRLGDRAPVGLEVLARMQHPARGILAPDLFVPQVEAAGLSFALTRAVVACAFRDWTGEALERLDVSLALNFPLDVLLHPAALVWLDEQREAAGIAAARIGIELTESRPVTDVADLAHAVAGLRAAGYSLAIDDVGPGVRDARDLLGLGFSALKLDKGLVAGSRDDAAMAAVLRATVADAHAANLVVVAEGVEDEACWRRMLEGGIEQAQGFLIAHPMPASAVPGWHGAWRAGKVLATPTI